MNQGTPTLHVKITKDDFTDNGQVKGHVILEAMKEYKAPLGNFMQALANQGLHLSPKTFIQACAQSSTYSQSEVITLMRKAYKQVYPALMATEDGKSFAKDMIKEVKRVYAQS